jgi:hypothetical protein
MKRLVLLFLVVGVGVSLAQDEPRDVEPETTLRHMQLMLHHAVGMAAEGAGLIALGQMQAAPDMDDLAVDRGRALVAEAKDLVREVAAGDGMMRMHAIELSDAANARMIAIHQLELAASNYITALENSLEDAGG